MICIIFSLLLFVKLAVGSQYYYFIGQGQELQECINAKNDITSNNGEKCLHYAEKYFLNCNEEITAFYCEENDTAFESIPYDPSITFNLMIASNLSSVHFSKLQEVSDIKVASFQESGSSNYQANTLILEGGQINAESLYLYSLIVNISGPVYLENIQLERSEILNVTKYQIQAISLSMDEYSLTKFLEFDTLPIKSDEYKYSNDNLFNLTITFTKDQWNMIGYSSGNDGLSVKNEFSIPYRIANMISINYNGENLTFNVDDPTSATLKDVQVSINQQIYLYATGNWSEPLSGPLNVRLSKDKSYYPNYETLDSNWFYLQFEVNSAIKPGTRIGKYVYFIGDGDEYAQCQQDKSKIGENLTLNCGTYEDKYKMSCSSLVGFTCNNDDSGFSQIQVDENSNVQIVIGTTTPSIDLSKLKNVTLIFILALSDSTSDGSANILQDRARPRLITKLTKNSNKDSHKETRADPAKTLTLSGCNIQYCSLIIGYLNIQITNANLIVNDFRTVECKILESELAIQAENILLDDYTMNGLANNIKINANILNIGSEENGYYNLTITFNQNSWSIFGYDDELCTVPNNLDVMYSFANRMSIFSFSDTITFNVNDPSTAVLKTIEINSEESSLAFISTGNWDSLNCDPLTVILTNPISPESYNTDMLNKKYFVFQPDIYPTVNNTVTPPPPVINNTTPPPIINDTTPPPFENNTTPLPSKIEKIYYFIGGNETELERCRMVKNEIESDKSLCEEYESEYLLECYLSFEMYCEENDNKFDELSYDGINSIGIMIGSNSPIINLSKLYKVDDVEMSAYGDFVGYPTKSVAFRADEMCHFDSLSIFALSISNEKNVTVNHLSLYYVVFVTSTNLYFQSEYLVLDDFTVQTLSSNSKIISTRCEIEKTGFSNATITFTENSWEIIDYLSTKTNSYTIPYSIADRFYLSMTGETITFNIENSATAILKTIELHSLQTSLTFISTGNWDDLKCDPLLVILDAQNAENYNTDLLKREYIEFQPNIYPDINDTTLPPIINDTTLPPIINDTTPPPIINDTTPPPFENNTTPLPSKIEKIYYFIVGNETELGRCRTVKSEIDANKSQCYNYKDEYLLDCNKDFEMYCEGNDDKFEELNKYIYIKDINIMIGTNTPAIDLSKLPKNNDRIFFSTW